MLRYVSSILILIRDFIESMLDFCQMLFLHLHLLSWSYVCLFFFYFFFFWLCPVAYGILVPWPRIEPRLLAVSKQSPNYWIAWKFSIILFLFFTLLMWCITLIYLQMLNHPCIPGINPTWSWCVILLMHFCIWFANVLLRIFACIFIRDIGL